MNYFTIGFAFGTVLLVDVVYLMKTDRITNFTIPFTIFCQLEIFEESRDKI